MVNYCEVRSLVAAGLNEKQATFVAGLYETLERADLYFQNSVNRSLTSAELAARSEWVAKVNEATGKARIAYSRVFSMSLPALPLTSASDNTIICAISTAREYLRRVVRKTSVDAMLDAIKVTA